jgi:hypothetical protein
MPVMQAEAATTGAMAEQAAIKDTPQPRKLSPI